MYTTYKQRIEGDLVPFELRIENELWPFVFTINEALEAEGLSDKILELTFADLVNNIKTTPPEDRTPIPTPINGDDTTSADWREFLRLYEEWVDEYIEFMEKYNADPTNLSLITEYLELTIKMLEWVEMADELEDELTGDDLREYLATLTRIILKLSAVE
jgi:hypothetical protein